jgi:CheY-like chemotaxis protein
MKIDQVFSTTTILVAEDDQITFDLISALLIGFGVGAVMRPDDHKHAMSLVAGGRPNLVISDVNFQDGEDFGLISDMRWSKNFPRRDIGFVVCTGHTNFETIMRARDLGASEIVAKPISAEELFKKITMALFEPRYFVDSSVYVGPCRRRRKSKWSGDDRRRNSRLSQRQIDRIMGIEG